MNDAERAAYRLGYSIGSGKMFTESFGDIQEEAERLLGRPVWTHEFASKEVNEAIREAAEVEMLMELGATLETN